MTFAPFWGAKLRQPETAETAQSVYDNITSSHILILCYTSATVQVAVWARTAGGKRHGRMSVYPNIAKCSFPAQ